MKCMHCLADMPENSNTCEYCGCTAENIEITPEVIEPPKEDFNFIPLSEEQLGMFSAESAPNTNMLLEIISQNIILQKGFNRLICLDEIEIEPKPYQFDAAVKVLSDMQGSAILADEVGLGKTIEAGLILKELLARGLAKSILILTPAPLVDQWIGELNEKFKINACGVDDDGWENNDVIIMSLPKFVRSKERQEIIYNRFFDMLLVDEAHCLKNHTTSSYKAVYKIHRKNTLLLSATPIQNDLFELFNLVNILKPGYLKNRKMFRENYIVNRFTPKNTENLKNLLYEVMIRNRRSNTLTNLPPRRVHNICVEFSENERKFYNGVINFCRDIFQKYYEGSISVGWEKTQMSKLMLMIILLLKENVSSPQATLGTFKSSVIPIIQESGTAEELAKANELIAIGELIALPSKLISLTNELKQIDGKAIVYTEYITTLELIEKHLLSEGFKPVVYHGKMNSDEKGEALQKFKSDEYNVLVATDSAGQGLNLQFCSNLFNYDLPWNPMKIEQRIGRIHRFGQKKESEIYSFETKGTIEEYILYILSSKISLFTMVIGQIDTILTYMAKEDSLDTRISKIILESPTVEDIEKEMLALGEEMKQASDEFDNDVSKSEELITAIGF